MCIGVFWLCLVVFGCVLAHGHLRHAGRVGVECSIYGGVYVFNHFLPSFLGAMRLCPQQFRGGVGSGDGDGWWTYRSLVVVVVGKNEARTFF